MSDRMKYRLLVGIYTRKVNFFIAWYAFAVQQTHTEL